MPNMSVKMTMSLDDLASPGLKKFMDLVEQLGPKVTGLSQRLNTLEKSFQKAGEAADKASGGVNKLDQSMTKLETSSGKVETAIQGLETLVKNFNSAIGNLNTVVNNLSTTFNGLATAATAAGTGLHTAAGGMGAASQGLGVLQGRVTSLTDSLRGMAEAWAAVKIFEAGKATVNEAAQYQQLEARLKSLNLPANETNEFVRKSKEMSKDLGFLSTNQAFESRLAALSGLGRNTSQMNEPGTVDIIDKTINTAVKAAMVIRQRGDTSNFEDIVRNLYGVVEMRGQTSSPEAMIRTFDLIVQNSAATQNKLTMKDFETASRYLKGGVGQNLSDEGYIDFASLMSQMKASGKGGGGSGGGSGGGVTGAATAITQLSKLWLGGQMPKEATRLWEAAGVMDSGKIRNDSDTTQVSIAAGAMKYSSEMIANPIKTLAEKIAPFVLAFTQKNAKDYYQGKDINDPRAQDEAMMKFFLKAGGSINAQQLMAVSMLPESYSRIASERKLTQGSDKTDAAAARLEKLFNLNVDKFNSALKSLEVTLGTTLLPLLTSFLEKAADFIRWLNDVADANPSTTQMNMFALALTGIGLALSAMQRLFGVFTILKDFAVFLGTTGVFTKAGAGVAAFGAAWTSAGSAITIALGVIRTALSRIFPLAAAFMIGWDIGTMISKLGEDGHTVHDWAVQFMGNLLTAFENGWIRIKSLMGLISDAQRDRMIAENNERNRTTLDTGRSKDAGRTRVGRITPMEHAETPAETTRRLLQEAAAGHEKDVKVLGPKDKNANKIMYNLGADTMRQQARIDKEQQILDMRDLEAAYKTDQISVEEYYKKKRELIEADAKAVKDDYKLQVEALLKPKEGKVDRAAVSRVTTDMIIADMKKESDLRNLAGAQEKDGIQMKSREIDLERELSTVSGNRLSAELMRQSKLAEARRQYWTINNRPDLVAKVDQVEKQSKAGATVEDNYLKLQSQVNVLKAKEKESTDEVAAGTLTQYEAERKVYDIKRAIGELEKQFIADNAELAAQSGDVKWAKILADLAQNSKAALTALSPEVLKIKGVLESGFTKFFQDGMAGATKLKDMFRSLFQSIITGLQNIIAQNAAQAVAKAIFGGSMGQAASAGGASGIMGLFSSGGGGGGWVESPSGMMVQAGEAGGPSLLAQFGSWISSLFSFDVGTSRVPADMLAQIHKDEIIVNARDASGIRSGDLVLGTGATNGVNIGNMHIQVDAGSGNANLQGDTGKGTALGRILTQSIQQEILRQKMPGGILA